MMKSKNLENKNKFQKGFTLIETFVAITILLITVTGPLVLVTKALSVSKTAKSQIVAIYLAQEAVEYIRNIRDGNILSGEDWLFGLGDCIDLEDGDKCKIDSPAESIGVCSLNGCVNLKYNPSTYLYGYQLGDFSKFKREIEIVTVTAGKEVRIIVGVSWLDGPNPHEFTVSESLFNWQ